MTATGPTDPPGGRAPGSPDTGSTVEGMLAVFDVEAVEGADGGSEALVFAGTSDGGARRVVDGSQLLAQAIVATSKALPGHTVRSAHALFTRAADDRRPLRFDVEVATQGRTVASAVVAVSQNDGSQGGAADGWRRCATVTLLADVVQPDLIRHGAAMPEVGGPDDAVPYDMPMAGRRLRMVGLDDPNDPDLVGPPVLDAWLHYEPVPTRPDLARALLAHFTGHLSVSTTMRPHPGMGTGRAHDDVSTAVLAIGVTFHEPVAWDGWLLYHHESTSVGAGMSYVRGQVFTEDGRLLVSFHQEAMIRSFDAGPAARDLPVEARL